MYHKLHGQRNSARDSARAQFAPWTMGIAASSRSTHFWKPARRDRRETLGSHVRRPAFRSRRLGRLERCYISREAHCRETDGFTVELGIYGLADVDLGGLDGDKAYEPRPLLEKNTTR